VNLSLSSSPSFKGAPIRSIESLAKALGVTSHRILYVSKHASDLYRLAKGIEKPDGSVRQTYDALPLLKNIQRRIKSNILDRVRFPDYLTGSIKGRDYKTNAALHQGAKIVITEDIGSFFPSTTDEHVYDIWRRFFGFSPDVAECLRALTTRHGELPQGGCTSPQLANLVFWRNEPRLRDRLYAEGVTYSRFVDDVAASSRTHIAPDKKREIIAAIYGLMLHEGYKPKRQKHELKTSRERMAVTTLTMNQKPGIDRAERARIRATVHHLEKLALLKQDDICQSSEFRSVLGKVNNLSRFHSGEAKLLKIRLERLRDRGP
jgi:hypothetical protein